MGTYRDIRQTIGTHDKDTGTHRVLDTEINTFRDTHGDPDTHRDLYEDTNTHRPTVTHNRDTH